MFKNLPVNVFYSDETNQYIAFVPWLSWMQTQAKTIDEAMKNLQEIYDMLKEDEDFMKELEHYGRFIGFYSLNLKNA